MTPEEVRARELRRDDLISRMVGRVNAHTTAEADRVIAGTKAAVAEAVVQVKDCFKESFCPEVSTTAPAKERLDALKARHSIERGLMAQLRKEAAEDRARPKPRRAAAKVETAEPKEPKGKKRAISASTATSSTGDGEVANLDAPVPVEKRTNPKRLCGALCRGTKQKPGKTCRKPFPCMFHPVAAAPEIEPAAAPMDEETPTVEAADASAECASNLGGMDESERVYEGMVHGALEAVETYRMSLEDHQS